MAADPTDPARFYIVEQGGTIRVVEDGRVRDELFFEIDRSDFTDRGWEQGLLGIALDPEWETSRVFYLNYTARDGATHVSRFRAESPHHAPVESEELVIRIEQPAANHNGGCIRFGPDGMLYIGMGDGGSAGDPWGNAQNLTSLLGKMLRIDVRSTTDGKPYSIPPDNPFIHRDDARPEIWSYGLRNPWRFEFDSRGRIWIGDVGQNKYEFVHLQREGSRGGENYGWNYMEGPERFEKRPAGQRDIVPDPSSLSPPVWHYLQSYNTSARVGSITGGFFYEGESVPSLRERYICADFMSGRVWSFRLRGGRADDIVEHTREFEAAFEPAGAIQAISSFGRDTAGELYVLDHKSGRVFKIVP